MAKYRLAQPARQDFNRILDDILEQEGRPGGVQFVETLAAAWEFLAEHPGAGHHREDLAPKPLRFWTVGWWFMCYRGSELPIEILYVDWARSDWISRMTLSPLSPFYSQQCDDRPIADRS